MTFKDAPVAQYGWIAKPASGESLTEHRMKFTQTFYRALQLLGRVEFVIVGDDAHRCLWMSGMTFESTARTRSTQLVGGVLIGRMLDVPVVYMPSVAGHDVIYLAASPVVLTSSPIDVSHVRCVIADTQGELLDAGVALQEILPSVDFDTQMMHAELDLIRTKQFLTASHQPG